MTEEEVKVKVILPWLASLGVRVEDLSLESAFSVRIGSRSLPIGSAAGTSDMARARLDILVRRGTHNLLIVETKAENESLTTADRDQAISYARLVHPIAPFALVTNGRTYELYDTITKERLEPASCSLDHERTVTLPDATRLEAVRLFLGLSADNLLSFCREQTARELAPLCGDADALSAVYVPSVHVTRGDVLTVLDEFLRSPSVGLAIIGESGTGKTGAVIDSVSHLLDRRYPVLFFRAGMLEGRIQDAIAHEVEFSFGQDFAGICALARLTEDTGRPLVLAVDGLEDWSYASRVQELGFLLARLNSAQVRLVLSCTTRRWSQFVEQRGRRTGSDAHLFRGRQDQPYSMELRGLPPREFYAAVRRYRRVYDFSGTIEREALEQAERNLFLLRLLFQVGSSSTDTPLSLQSSALCEEYLALVMRRTSNEAVAGIVLTSLADLLARHDEEFVDESEVSRVLGLGNAHAVLTELLDLGVLVGVGRPGSRRISFGFSHLRSHLIAHHARRWSSMNPSAFAEDVAGVASGGVLSEALVFYYGCAQAEHRAPVDSVLRQKAADYVRSYVSIVNVHFPALRAIFAPATTGRVGLVAELNVPARCLGFRGLRSVTEGSEEVLFFATGASSRRDRQDAFAFHLGVERLQWTSSAHGFNDLDVPKEVVSQEISPQLKKMVKKGLLNDAGTVAVLREALHGMAQTLLKYSHLPGVRDRAASLTPPATIGELLTAVRRIELRAQFADDVIADKRERGLIPETWTGSVVSFSPSLSPEEAAIVDARVDEALSRPHPNNLHVRLVEVEPIRQRLTQLIDELGPAYPIAPPPRQARQTGVHGLALAADDYDALQTGTLSVLALALADYRAIVERNFPTVRHFFPTYRLLPSLLVATFGWGDTLATSTLDLYWCAAVGQQTSVVAAQTAVLDRHERTSSNLRTSAGDFSCQVHETMHLNAILSPPSVGTLDYHHQTAAVRPVVYQWLRTEYERAERDIASYIRRVASAKA